MASIGAPRTFRMTRGTGKERARFDLRTGHGTVIELSCDANRRWKHEVLHRRGDLGRRISLTFRAFRDNASVLNDFRAQLGRLFQQGVRAKSQIDRLLGTADSREDFRIMLRLADPSRWLVLRDALRTGRVVTRRYVSRDEPDETGCPAYFLFGLRSNEELLSPSFIDDVPTLKAVSRTVRNVDYQVLTTEMMETVLEEELAHRQQPESRG